MSCAIPPHEPLTPFGKISADGRAFVIERGEDGCVITIDGQRHPGGTLAYKQP